MRNVDTEYEVHDLANDPGLHIGDIIGVLEALADPYVAFGVVVIRLSGSDLDLALDVAVGVGSLVVVDLLAAGSLHGCSSEAGGGGGDETVGGDGDEEAG